jgi:HlyD family secretion protein
MADESTNGTEPGIVTDAVRDLERELRAQGARRWLRRLAVLGVLTLAVVGFITWRRMTAPPPPPRFTTEKLEHRDIFEQVQSTGTVKPLTEVQVGAQVSGRVVKVFVDFNSKVKRGDALAEIDPSLFGAQVNQAGAQLKAAEASLKRAEARFKTTTTALGRAKALASERVGSQAELDQAQGEYDVAEADRAAARAQIGQIRAQLSSAQTTLAYTRIFSPIDGVVINRAVDPGQTVAASFSAPVMFVIAQDLSKMQVLADIDEADVGKLAEQMPAEIVVDAFPGEKFNGRVTQIRFSPNTVQGVVTYSAVVDVDNPELKLRPGMTATVTVRAKQVRAALAVRNSALRFKPLPELDDSGRPKPVPPPAPLKPGQGRVYFVKGGTPGHEEVAERVIDIGLTDGVWTQVKPSVADLTDVVTEQHEDKKRGGFRLF